MHDFQEKCQVSISVIKFSVWLRLITPTSTLIIPDITNTSSNNCLYTYLFLSKGAQTLLVKPRLPPEDKHFMGRKKECEKIMCQLSSESTRIVCIFGPAGFGKSQVAIAVGNELHFQGKTVYHLELRRVQNKKELISKFLCNFKVSPNCRDLEPEDSLFYQLSQVNDHLYFILDNADRLLEPNVRDDVINLIKEILTKFSNLTFIVTTRESPTFLHLESLDRGLTEVGRLGKFYCKNLVQQLLPDSNDSERNTIAQLCGYMPFAIILMCRSITQSKKPLNEAINEFIRSTKRIVRELDDSEDVSDSGLIGIFGSSFEGLSQNDKEAFVTFSVIPGSFDVDLATAVLGKSRSKAEMTLKRLQRRSLIESNSGSYQMYKLLQSFGSEKGDNEMNEVFRNAQTRLEEHYLSKFSKLNEIFLSGTSKSMSAFIAFYKDKDRFLASLIEGCSESGTTRDRAFDALMNAELFLDTLLWSDRITFDKIYDSALKEAEKSGNITVYQELVVAKAFGEVTWGTAEGKAIQTLTEIRPSASSDRGKSIEGKRACYLGIHQLVSGKLKEGVKLLKEALSHLDSTIGQFLILKALACQILSLYYESENRLQKAKEFLKMASEECNKIGDPSLLVIPQINENVPKEENASQNLPLALVMYFLISKAIKIFSPKTMKSLEHDVLRMKREIYRDPSANIGKVVANFHFQRNVVGVLAEINKYDEAIQSIQATISLQKKVLMQCTNDGVGSHETEDLKLQEHKEALAKSYSYLSVLEFHLKDYKASFESQRCTLEIRREIFGERHASTVDSYHELAIILRTMGDCLSALHFQERILDVRLNLSDQNPSKTADSYHELGVTQCKTGDFAAALCSHERALHIRLEHLGHRDLETARSYHELGISQWCMKKYQCALEYHEKARSVALDVLGEFHSVTADSYYELGKTHFCLKDYRTSLRLHLRAQRLRSKLLGDEHPDTAKSNHELGVTRYAMEQYPLALRHLKCALAARQKIHGAQHEDVAQSYHQLGRIQYKMQDYTQAFESYNSAVSIRKRLLEENHSKRADNYYGLGILYFSNQDSASAFVKEQTDALTNGQMNLDQNAKTADSLYHMASYVQRKLQNYELSLQLHQCALDIRLQLSGQKHTAKTADSYHQLGLVLCDLARYDEALNSHQKALEIRLELLGYSHAKTAYSYLQTSNIQLKKMVFDSALESLQHAVQIATELLSKQKQELAHCSLAKKVNEAFLQDDASGLQLFQHASTFSQKFSTCLPSQNHSLKKQVANLKKQLIEKAKSYHELGNREITKLKKTRSYLDHVTPALHLQKHALETNRTLLGERHPDTAFSYQILGSTQFTMNDLTSAAKSFQCALDVRLELFGEKHPETADSYYELGVTQLSLNDLTSALQSLQRALDIRLELFVENHEKTADCYYLLGNTELKMKDLTSALHSHQRALDIRLELVGENHKTTADCYYSLGNTQLKMRDLTSALQSHQRALDIRLKLFGEIHEKTADSYHQLGLIQSRLRDLTSTLQSLQRELDIRLELVGENHKTTAESYFLLGNTQWTKKDLTSALQSHQRALAIRLELFGKKHEKTAESYYALGIRQLSLRDSTSALQSIQCAVDIRLELFGENHKTTAKYFEYLAVAQFYLNDLTSALRSNQLALNIRLKLFGWNHPDTAHSYKLVGMMKRALNNFISALWSLQLALDINIKTLGENHPETADTRKHLKNTQNALSTGTIIWDRNTLDFDIICRVP